MGIKKKINGPSIWEKVKFVSINVLYAVKEWKQNFVIEHKINNTFLFANDVGGPVYIIHALVDVHTTGFRL